jgi:hypothetical protein
MSAFIPDDLAWPAPTRARDAPHTPSSRFPVSLMGTTHDIRLASNATRIAAGKTPDVQTMLSSR